MKKKKQEEEKNVDMPDERTDEHIADDASGEEQSSGEEQISSEAVAEAQTEASKTAEDTDDEMTQKYNELLNRYQRTLAEFDNFRKRTMKEKASMYDDGVRETVEKLLPVIDNFERALNTKEDKEDKFYQGVVMIAKQLSAYLTELGVEPIPAGQGEGFNHHVHFAVAHVEDSALEANVITDELQKGYKYKDKVIRPSMVRVAN